MPWPQGPVDTRTKLDALALADRNKKLDASHLRHGLMPRIKAGDEAGGGISSSTPNPNAQRQAWHANGPYIVDTAVDGPLVAPAAMIITAVWIARTTPGSSGSTVIDLNKNGVTMYTTQGNRPTISTAETSSHETQPDVTSVIAGDVLTVDIDTVEAGTPEGLSLVLEWV